MKAMGSATANQLSQETELPPLPISWMAKMFCGEEMGLVIPPRLDAKAIPANGIDPSLLLANDSQTEEAGCCDKIQKWLHEPGAGVTWEWCILARSRRANFCTSAWLQGGCLPRTRLLAKLWPEGSVRRIGCSSEKHSTGAATLVIHMEANVATSILAISTYCGLEDTLDSTQVAMRLAMKCLVKALAMAKPPSSSMMVCASVTALSSAAVPLCKTLIAEQRPRRCGLGGLHLETST